MRHSHINDPELLSAFPRSGFIPANNMDYHAIETSAKAIGLEVTEKDTASIALDLHCKGVTYSGKTVLSPFHLQVIEGQHIAILGASGAEKQHC